MFQAYGTIRMVDLLQHECLVLLCVENFRLMRMTSFRERIFPHAGVLTRRVMSLWEGIGVLDEPVRMSFGSVAVVYCEDEG